MATHPLTASVLIVEDSGAKTDNLLAKLRRDSGVPVSWERVNTLPALREALVRRQDWHLVVSDGDVAGVATFQALAVTHEIAPRIPFVVVSHGGRQESVAEVIEKWVSHRSLEVAARAPLNPESRTSRSQLFDFARRLLEAQEAERRHIARELHDEFGQLLTAVRLKLETAQRQSGRASAEAMVEATALVSRAIEQVRNFSIELWPTVLDDLGLPAALRWLVDNQARSADLNVRLEIDAFPRLAHEVEITCFRLVQESLTNVARHAAARDVDVRMKALPGGAISLQIKDDGKGFDVDWVRERAVNGGPPSFGLLGMQERALMIGGQFDIHSVPGQGTTVTAQFPTAPESVA